MHATVAITGRDYNPVILNTLDEGESRVRKLWDDGSEKINFQVRKSRAVHMLPPMLKERQKFSAFLEKRRTTTCFDDINTGKMKAAAQGSLCSYHGGEPMFTRATIIDELMRWRKQTRSAPKHHIPEHAQLKALKKAPLASHLSAVRGQELPRAAKKAGKGKQKESVKAASEKQADPRARFEHHMYNLVDEEDDAGSFSVSDLLGRSDEQSAPPHQAHRAEIARGFSPTYYSDSGSNSSDSGSGSDYDSDCDGGTPMITFSRDEQE